MDTNRQGKKREGIQQRNLLGSQAQRMEEPAGPFPEEILSGDILPGEDVLAVLYLIPVYGLTFFEIQ